MRSYLDEFQHFLFCFSIKCFIKAEKYESGCGKDCKQQRSGGYFKKQSQETEAQLKCPRLNYPNGSRKSYSVPPMKLR